MKHLYGIVILCSFLPYAAHSQIFAQDFNSSTVLADYVGAPPNNTQFDVLGASGGGVTVSINAGRLEFVRTSANAGGAIRNTDFSSTPVLMKAEFDLEVPAATANQTTAAQLYFGDGFSSNITAGDAGATFHTKIGINLISGGGFQIRNINGSVNSVTFNGENHVTLFSNNSGASANYSGPDGSTTGVANDKIDVWVNNTLIFNDMNANAAGAGVGLNEFKFIFSTGTGTITLDNILISEFSALPVTLLSFRAKAGSASVDLFWRTATETDNDYFSVERSSDGRQFAEIGRVAGAGTSFLPGSYQYTDDQPVRGVNYYRLRQVDFDGTFSYSPVVTAAAGKDAGIRLYPSPATDILTLHLPAPLDAEAAWQIFDQSGRLVLSGTVREEGVRHEVDLATLPEGMYAFVLFSGNEALTKYFRKQ